MNDSVSTSDVILERLTKLHPKLIDLSLDRTWRLLGALGHPERALPPVFHIAGTNGKGSVSAYLRAALEAGGIEPDEPERYVTFLCAREPFSPAAAKRAQGARPRSRWDNGPGNSTPRTEKLGLVL